MKSSGKNLKTSLPKTSLLMVLALVLGGCAASPPETEDDIIEFKGIGLEYEYRTDLVPQGIFIVSGADIVLAGAVLIEFREILYLIDEDRACQGFQIGRIRYIPDTLDNISEHCAPFFWILANEWE